MDYLGEALKLLPRPIRTIYTVLYLIFAACILMGWFNISFPGQTYVLMITVACVFLIMGVAFISGGVIEMRQAREEKRKPVFYKRIAMYAGIACVLSTFLLVYDFLAPAGVPENVGWIVTCICIIAFIFGLAPAVYYQIQVTNQAGAEALKKVQQEQEQKNAERERLQAEGKEVPELERNQPRKRLQLFLLLLVLLFFLGSMIGMAVAVFTKVWPYDFGMIGFSCVWLCGCLFIAMRRQDIEPEEPRPWYQHMSTVYVLAGVLFLAYYITHYLLISQHILSKDVADKFNIIPFITLVAVLVLSNIISKKRTKNKAAATS